MFTKSFLLHGAVLAFSVAHVASHAVFSPALGVQRNNGAGELGDVKMPNEQNPCGNLNGVSIANALSASNPVKANANGVFNVQVRNFNTEPELDGSRQVTQFKVNADGDGQSFVDALIKNNGQRAPNNIGTEVITGQIPSNVQCTGGASDNLCVFQLITASGFGNCVAVQQQRRGNQGINNAQAQAANQNGRGHNVRVPDQVAGKRRISTSETEE